MLVNTALWTVPPFLIAMDIAATSTWCDTLMNELNDARSNHGPESHLKIQWLETTLRQLVRRASAAPPPPLSPPPSPSPFCELCNHRQALMVRVASATGTRTRAKAWASNS